MPEIKKVFLRGKMNKDLDERLIPDGEYTDAQNIQVSSTNESDAGTVQNIRGTKLLTDLSEESKFGNNAKCIGKIADEENDKIYWFVKSSTKQGIIEHDTGTNISKPIVIDTTGAILNFPDYEITGIAILDRNIIWTDNNSEPKIIDIDEFVTYSTYTNATTPYAATTQISGADITESDITVIKKKPISAPEITINNNGTFPEKPLFEDKIVRFAYRWKFTDGQYSVISPFTDPIFDPDLNAGYNLDEGYNDRMLNNISDITLTIDQSTYPSNLESIDILYKEANNANVYIYETITDVSSSVSKNITKESVYSVLPENQLIRQYDNVPYKAKALDIIGNRLVFGNYVDGLNLNNYSPNFNIGTVQNSNTMFQSRNPSTISGVNNTGRRTIKSGRTYQLGISFEDEYGRQTPIISNETGLIKRDFTGNAPVELDVKLSGSEPTDSRIDKFKLYIKDSAAEYYNFIAENVYDDNQNTSHAWISVPSYEINKVQENDTIVLKKAANGGLVSTISKYKILDISESVPTTINDPGSISTDARFFIKVKKDNNLTAETISQGGITGNSEINSNSSNWVGPEYIVPTNALYLGQYTVQDSQYENTRYRYYFKDGKIIEVEDKVSVDYNIANDFAGASHTFNQQPTCDSNQPSNWAAKSATYPFTDSTGTVSQIYFKNVNTNFPDSFFICYSSTQTPSGSGSGPAIFETVPDDNVLDIYYEISDSYPISAYNDLHTLNWYNAFDFDDGVESNRIKDDFNKPFISTQVRVSTTINTPFKQKTNKSGLIYSGLYNSRNGVNDLNQFNTGEKITKNLNPEYGSIQKLHARDTDLIAFCEDKVLRILANKDALFNADGNVNLVSTNNVLGQAVPYSGEFGISKDPESFATNGNRIYFADKSRNTILRLSRDGLTIISSKGMKTYFRDKINNQLLKIVGAYDQYSDQYIISFDNANVNEAESLSFKEDVDGWVSRLTYVIKPALSMNGKFYSFNSGNLYEHYHPSASTNTFHDDVFKSSGVQLIFNQEASAIKNFKTISYEGTQAKTSSKQGWSVGSIITDQQEGQVIEFKEKEGKWFANISGVTKDVGIEGTPDIDVQEFAVQGIGNLDSLGAVPTEFECSTAVYSMTTGNVGDPSTSVATVSLGVIKSITPATLQEGEQEYTATITAPSTGYTNSSDDITCKFTLTLTSQENLTCTTNGFVLNIDDGSEGDAVTGSASINGAALTIQAINPGVYQPGSGLTYTATILVPAGYANQGATIDCDDTATAATGAYDCNTFSDWVTTSYDVSTGNITVLPKRPSTTVHSYTPTGSTPNQGNVPITYTFSDNGATWSNSGTQIQCIDGITVDTTVTYSAAISGPSTFQVNSNTSLSVIVEGDGVYNQNVDVTSQLSDPVDFVWSGPASMSGITGTSTGSFTESAAGEVYTYYVTIDTTSLTGSSSSIVASKNIEWVDGPTVQLSASTSIAFTGDNVELTANGQNISNASFEFSESYNDGATWSVVQAFSSDNTFTATKTCGTNPGVIRYKVRMDGTNSITNTPLANPVENDQTNNKITVVWNDAPEWNLYFESSQAILHSICDTDINTLQQVSLFGNTLTGAPNDPSFTTELYQNCERTIDAGGGGTYLHIDPDGTKKYAYFNGANILAQPNSAAGWLPCSNIYLTIIDGAQTIDITNQTIEKCAGIDSVQITANIEGFEYDEILWSPTGSTSLSTTASSETVQPITYICTATNNTTNQTLTASTTIDFVNCSTVVAARKCASTTQPLRYLRVDGIASMANAGDVVEFTAINNSTLPEGDGCYTLIQKTEVTESPQATVSVTDVVGFSDCDSCNCDPTGTSEFTNISFSDSIKYIYADGGGYNTITLSASVTNAICLSTASYQWYAGLSTDKTSHISIKTTSSNSTTVTYQELTNAGLSITPGSTPVHYHCKLSYTIGNGSSQSAESDSTQGMSWINLPEFTLSYLNSGTASNPDDSICSSTSGSTLYPVFGNEGQDPGQDNLLLATKFYSNAERTQTPANGTWKSNYTGNATNIYTYLLGGVPQTPTGAVSGTNWRACAANFSLTSNKGDSGITLCNNETANLFANYDPNVLTLNTSTYEWRVNNVTQTSYNGQANFTASNPGGTGLVIYGVSVQDTNGTSYGDQFQIQWQDCSVKVRVRKCGNSTGYAVATVLGTSTIANGVFELTAEPNQQLPEGNGCYTILQTTTESSNAEVTAIGPNGDSGQPYASCSVSACNPVDEFYLLSRCLDGAQYRTSQTIENLSYYVNQILEYNTQSYAVIGTTTNTGVTSISSFTTTSYTSCPAYYGLQKCSDQSTNHRSSVDVEQFTLNVGDRVSDILTGEFYVVQNNTATSGNLATVISTGLTGCPEPTQNYYQIRECSTGTDYRTQRTTDAVVLYVGNIVYNQTGDVFFTVISNTAQVGDFPEYSTQVYQSPYSSCPLGSYNCNTYNDWVTASYNSSTGNITLTPVRNTTTVTTSSPTNTASGQGVITVTYSFQDSDVNWSNTDEIISGCTISVDTGTATVYRATFIDCAGSGAVVHVRSVNLIDTNQVISDSSKCYRFLNNNGDSSNEADISTYTAYNDPDLDSTGNCGVCDAVVNPTTTTTTTTTLAPCIAVDVYRTRFNPATNPDAMDILCGNGFATTQYFNASSVGAATIYYSDFTCTTYKSTPEYISDANNTSQYYYWNGNSLTLIGNTGPCQ